MKLQDVFDWREMIVLAHELLESKRKRKRGAKKNNGVRLGHARARYSHASVVPTTDFT